MVIIMGVIRVYTSSILNFVGKAYIFIREIIEYFILRLIKIIFCYRMLQCQPVQMVHNGYSVLML